jgi:hypothetical protein
VILPSGATPGNIGKIVTVQIIPRKEDGTDELDLDNAVKNVGRLMAYSATPDGFGYTLEGCDELGIKWDKFTIELYVY